MPKDTAQIYLKDLIHQYVSKRRLSPRSNSYLAKQEYDLKSHGSRAFTVYLFIHGKSWVTSMLETIINIYENGVFIQ